MNISSRRRWSAVGSHAHVSRSLEKEERGALLTLNRDLWTYLWLVEGLLHPERYQRATQPAQPISHDHRSDRKQLLERHILHRHPLRERLSPACHQLPVLILDGRNKSIQRLERDGHPALRRQRESQRVELVEQLLHSHRQLVVGVNGSVRRAIQRGGVGQERAEAVELRVYHAWGFNGLGHGLGHSGFGV
mgnify:CR=1 FL=1|jgi:hypothetical protein